MRFLLFILALVLCISCDFTPKNTPFTAIYSFTKEIEYLTNENPFVFKTVTKDGFSKSVKTQINWEKELNLFKNAEINFQKFQSEYTIEKVTTGNKTVINCRSNSEKIKTKHIQYIFNNGKCEMVYMQRLTIDKINNNYQEMYYQPRGRYEINGTQKTREIDSFTYKVVGEFVSNKTKKRVVELTLKKEVLPFFMELNSNGATIYNGDEKINITSVYQKGDTTIMELPVFNSELRYITQGKNIKGRWCNLAKGSYSIPFSSTNKRETRFDIQEFDTQNFEGKWEVTFSEGTEGEYPAIGIFTQEGNKVTGTFLTETGDYRFLEGNVNGNKLLLSCFDGAHAFLFKASMDKKGELHGQFFSGNHWKEPWGAKRTEQVKLTNPYTLTQLIDSTKEFVFSFPNLDSVMVSNKDKKYQNKVLIVQIMGSWCPNCMDETLFFAELYQQYNDKGLELISICFEKYKNFDKNKKSVLKLKNHFNTSHTYLIGGFANKKNVEKAFPQLNHFMSYPTTLFIDRKGNVRKIHTGFYGPSTGAYYEMYVEETTRLIENLLVND